jgi:hypothetical protein
MNPFAMSTRVGVLLLISSTGLLHAETTSLSHTPATINLPAQPPAPLIPDGGGAGQTPELALTAQFDKDGDHRLDAAERQAARAFLREHPLPDPTMAPLRPGRPPPQPVALEPVNTGDRIDKSGVPLYPDHPLYDAAILRTLFLEFDDRDWEKELAEFSRTDVRIPARLTVDGRVHPGVGVRWHPEAAAALPAGYKRSLELTLDYTESGGRIDGQASLTLLAATTDPTLLRTMLYMRVAREYLPAPKTGFVRVVINGENWGVYVTSQPLDGNFVQENFHATAGTRWTAAPGGNLSFLGDQPEPYRGRYRLLSPEDPAAWAALIRLCRAIEQAKPGEFEATVGPLLDIDGALKFFALENALINQCGYGSSTGSYGLYLDESGRFHLIPQDAEASYRLVQVSEYGDRPQRGGAGRGGRGDSDPKGDGAGDPATRALAKAKGRENFPRQSDTNLAMLLSYSFVNKSDSDQDGKVTREEWLDFARAWFFAMDEDQAGQLTRVQFIDKVRQLVTPASMVDGHSRQTFGKEDAAGMIGRDLFAAMDENHDDHLTRDELVGAFDRWFKNWSNPKSARLTQELIQTGLGSLLSQSVFKADQEYIAVKDPAKSERDENGAGRGGGRRGGGSHGGNGLNVGPLHLGLPGGGRDWDSRTLVTFSEELDPLAGFDDATKPLLVRLLAAPALRSRYVEYVRDIAESWLSWSKIGPTAKEYHNLIAAEVRKDTHKATSYEHFVQEFDLTGDPASRDGDAAPSLKAFVEERGAYLRKDDTVNGRTDD